jgi:FKBP-type peptidyl-prolyl cis-trans isomerase FkpA
MRKISLVAFVAFLLAAACDGNDPIESAEAKFYRQLAIDSVLIDEYLAARGITALPDTIGSEGSGIRYVIHESGTGRSPKYNSRVPGDCFETDYIGRLLDGDVPFDTAYNFKTSLSSGIISGWKRGFQYLQEGDSATIYITSGYGYGSAGSGTRIPKNAILYFNVRLRKVVTPEFNPANGQYECYYDDL